MPVTTFTATTPDGELDATLHTPEGQGPWPAVVVFPDAGGARDSIRAIAERVAEMGYAAAVPNVYYRAGDYEPFDFATAFSDEGERARLFSLMGSLTNDKVTEDAAALIDALLARPDVAGDVQAKVFVAGAKEDGSFTEEQKDLLERTLTEAGVDHTVEIWDAHHGFAVKDNPTYDEAAEAKHYEAMERLYGEALRRTA